MPRHFYVARCLFHPEKNDSTWRVKPCRSEAEARALFAEIVVEGLTPAKALLCCDDGAFALLALEGEHQQGSTLINLSSRPSGTS